MQEIYKEILKNSENLCLVSDVRALVLLIYIHRKKEIVSAGEISEYFNLEDREVSKLLSRLSDKGLVEKIDWLDKSMKPPFLQSGYRILENNFESMISDLTDLFRNCLPSAD